MTVFYFLGEESFEEISTSPATSDCGECCGGHAPYPQLPSDPREPGIIPATMCQGTQISPTSVVEMYAASLSRKSYSMISRYELQHQKLNLIVITIYIGSLT